MNKRLTRITSIFSISLLTAAMFSISSVSSTTYVENPLGPPTEEAVELEVLSEYPELHLKRERMAPMPREYRAAISKEAKDWKGYEKSLYRGKYYNKDQEHFRECVMYRESRHNYRAANRVSSARGAYQFLDNSWRDGLVYMMIKESKKNDHGLEKKLKSHFNKPIHKWNRYYQDRAFFTALNYNGKWSGKKHWNETVTGTSCSLPNNYRSSTKPKKQNSAEYKRAQSKSAKDLHGYEQSLYRGKYYNSGQESWRKCVMWRESNYNYSLIGAGYNHPYHGAYQFHNVNWKRGLTYMMAGESKQTKDGLNAEARKLIHKNINQWNRYWQDRALFTALNYRGMWSGAHHWNATRYGC